MTQPIALITGIAGQDGAYLAQLLLSKRYQVFGTARAKSDLWRLRRLGILDQVSLTGIEDADEFLGRLQPTEVYHLAANSSVTDSLANPLVCSESDALGTHRLLEAVRLRSPQTRFFFASSAEMFVPGDGTPQAETSRLGPRSPYACAKVYGYHLCQTYRLAYQTFACSGILFNHESPLRGAQFVTRKITSGLERLRVEGGAPLQLGNLDSRRDWGCASEFVEAMWRMLQADQADDYVLATGRTYSVRDFCEFAASAGGFELVWQLHEDRELGVERTSGRTLIVSEVSRFRANDAPCRIGDPGQAAQKLGWHPAIYAPQLAKMMMDAENSTASSGKT